MKINVEKSYLQAALKAVSRATSSSRLSGILSNVLLETEEDRIKLTASDLDTTIRAVIPAQVSEEGSVCVSAALLSGLASSFEADTVSVSSAKQKVAVRNGRSDSSLACVSVNDYPALPFFDSNEGSALTVPQAALKAALSRVASFTGDENLRTAMAGVSFQVRGNALKICATNSHVLSKEEVALGDMDSEIPEIDFLLPRRTTELLTPILSTNPEEFLSIRVDAKKSLAQFEVGEITLLSGFLDGRFPEYEKFIPRDFTYQMDFYRTDLSRAVSRLMLFKADFGEPKLLFDWTSEAMTISVEGSDKGTITEEIPCVCKFTDEAETGEAKVQTAINGNYVNKFLSSIGGEEMTWKTSGGIRPVVICSDSAPTWLGMAMTMHRPVKSEATA